MDMETETILKHFIEKTVAAVKAIVKDDTSVDFKLVTSNIHKGKVFLGVTFKYSNSSETICNDINTYLTKTAFFEEVRDSKYSFGTFTFTYLYVKRIDDILDENRKENLKELLI